VLDATGKSLAYVYGRESKANADTAHVLTMDEAIPVKIPGWQSRIELNFGLTVAPSSSML
jgi:hypothetical protein